MVELKTSTKLEESTRTRGKHYYLHCNTCNKFVLSLYIFIDDFKETFQQILI